MDFSNKTQADMLVDITKSIPSKGLQLAQIEFCWPEAGPLKSILDKELYFCDATDKYYSSRAFLREAVIQKKLEINEPQDGFLDAMRKIGKEGRVSKAPAGFQEVELSLGDKLCGLKAFFRASTRPGSEPKLMMLRICMTTKKHTNMKFQRQTDLFRRVSVSSHYDKDQCRRLVIRMTNECAEELFRAAKDGRSAAIGEIEIVRPGSIQSFIAPAIMCRNVHVHRETQSSSHRLGRQKDCSLTASKDRKFIGCACSSGVLERFESTTTLVNTKSRELADIKFEGHFFTRPEASEINDCINAIHSNDMEGFSDFLERFGADLWVITEERPSGFSIIKTLFAHSRIEMMQKAIATRPSVGHMLRDFGRIVTDSFQKGVNQIMVASVEKFLEGDSLNWELFIEDMPSVHPSDRFLCFQMLAELAFEEADGFPIHPGVGLLPCVYRNWAQWQPNHLIRLAEYKDLLVAEDEENTHMFF